MMAKQITVDDVVTFVSSSRMTPQDREQIVRALTASRARAQIQAGCDLRLGDRVQFNANKAPYCGKTIVGRIRQVNKMTVIVIAEGGYEWRVSPSLLTKLV